MDPIRLTVILIFIGCLSNVRFADCVKCYACVYTDPPDIDLLLDNITAVQGVYSISSAWVQASWSEQCNASYTIGQQINFTTVQCFQTCTKIMNTTMFNGTTLYIRGCKESLFSYIPQQLPCDPDDDVAISECDCASNLCNKSGMLPVPKIKSAILLVLTRVSLLLFSLYSGY